MYLDHLTNQEILIKSKFLRILDYHGSFDNVNMGESLSRYCIDKEYHHVEFLHFGSEKRKILK